MLKRFSQIFVAVISLLAAAASHGLADASAPTKIQIPFANGAGGAYVRTVPVPSQIGIQNGAASYTDGFPPLNFVPVNAGGVPPFGQDMNGILRDVSAHARWWAAGGPVYYDSAYQTAIGGYPKGAIVQSATVTGKLWFSSTENNVTNPDTGGAGWSPVMNTVYAPLTGTGASGTWGINITGNAVTANSATSATNATNATNATTAVTATANGAKAFGRVASGGGFTFTYPAAGFTGSHVGGSGVYLIIMPFSLTNTAINATLVSGAGMLYTVVTAADRFEVHTFNASGVATDISFTFSVFGN